MNILLKNENQERQLVALAVEVSAATSAGLIYAVDYTRIKLALNHILDASTEVVTDLLRGKVSAAAVYQLQGDGFLSETYIHRVQGQAKRFRSRLWAADPDLAVVGAFYNFWNPFAGSFAALKPLVIKARKPSDRPRQTPARTLDHTGTCAICGQNVKIAVRPSGVLVEHGFKIEWASRMGQCFGAGRRPWEVSPEAASAYIDDLRLTAAYKRNTLESLPTATAVPYSGTTLRAPKDPATGQPKLFLLAGDLFFAMGREAYARGLTWQIGAIGDAVRRFETRVAAWTQQPLPGGAA